MKTKLNKISLGSLLGILTIAIIVAVAWATVASNAFATDDEANLPEAEAPEAWEAADPATDNEVNVTRKISFNIQGLAEGDTAKYRLDNKTTKGIDYTLGAKLDLEVDKNSSVKYSKIPENPSITASGVDGLYSFNLTTPLGYKFKDFSPSLEPSLDSDVDFSIILETDPTPYTVNLYVENDYTEEAVDGYKVSLYDKDWNFVEEKATDNKGNCIFSGLTAHQALGFLVGQKEGLTDSCEYLSDARYYKHETSVTIYPSPAEHANINMNAQDPNHEYFKFYIKGLQSGIVRLEQTLYKESILMEFFDVEGTWKTDEQGTLLFYSSMEPTPGMLIEYYIELSGCPKDGYKIDHWLIDTAHNEVQEVYPNSEFTIPTGGVLNAQPVYAKDEPTPPGPEPEPTPTPSEEVNATAQTGDSTAALPLAILAIAAGAVVFVARRKASKTF